jgi:radical SAM superfamily enzyme YgiQ (UPF0313 family)
MIDYADFFGKIAIKRRVLVGPPLGLNDIAGMLSEDDVIIIDQKAELEKKPTYEPENAIIEEIRNFKPEIVGFTCLTAQFNSLKKVLKAVKQFDKQILTVLGGIHVTSCPEEFHDFDADLLVLGTGKTTFYQIVQEVKKNRDKADFSKISGLAIKNGKQLYYTQAHKSLSYEDYQKIHFRDDVLPNRELTDRYNYKHPGTGMTIQYLSTSLGCTHRCNFCYLWQMTDGRYLYRNVESIIAELKTMSKYQLIRFCDAHTFGMPAKAMNLFERLKEEQFKHFYFADVRADTVVKHPELMKLAHEAGMLLTVIGLEATSDKELTEYGKGLNLKTIEEALEILNQTGIYASGNYIIRPDFDEKDFDRVARFVEDHPIFFSGFTILTPFPGTEQWDLLKNQIVIHDLDYYNLANAVLATKLPEKKFYQRVCELYR